MCNEHDRCTALEFLRNVEPRHKEAAARLLYRMEHRHPERGPRQGGTAKTRCLNGIWEWKEGRLRILWFEDERRDAIVTHGFVKPKGMRFTPPEQLTRATEAKEQHRQGVLMGTIEVIEEATNDGQAT